MTEDEFRERRQKRLDILFKIIIVLIVIVVTIAMVAIFIQIYNINAKINTEVKQISAVQERNHIINNEQNSVILGYLICIGNIQPVDRTPTIIANCVAQAKKTDTDFNK